MRQPLFCLYKGLVLAHKLFDQSNAMLAFSGIYKFSVKNIKHMAGTFLILNQVILNY